MRELAVDEQRDDATDDRAEQSGGLEVPVRVVVTEDHPAEEPADERADDAQQHGATEAQVVLAWHDQAGDRAGDEPDDHNSQWTQRQVDERRGRSVTELLAEWSDVAPRLEQWMRDNNPRPLGDVIIHEQDLRGALGVSGGQDTAGLHAIRDLMISRFATQITGALTLQGEQWSWSSGHDGPATVISAGDFDLARAIVSRRSAAQLRSWTTSGDVEPYLDAFAVLGSLPDTDLRE